MPLVALVALVVLLLDDCLLVIGCWGAKLVELSAKIVVVTGDGPMVIVESAFTVGVMRLAIVDEVVRIGAVCALPSHGHEPIVVPEFGRLFELVPPFEFVPPLPLPPLPLLPLLLAVTSTVAANSN